MLQQNHALMRSTRNCLNQTSTINPSHVNLWNPNQQLIKKEITDQNGCWLMLFNECFIFSFFSFDHVPMLLDDINWFMRVVRMVHGHFYFICVFKCPLIVWGMTLCLRVDKVILCLHHACLHKKACIFALVFYATMCCITFSI